MYILSNLDTIGTVESVLNREMSGVVKYTNVAFGTDESVLFIEVSSIQGCLYREVPLYIHILHLLCIYT